MLKLPCTRAQLLKKGRIKVIPEQDSTGMLVQTPSHVNAPSFPQEPPSSKGAQVGRGHFSAPCCPASSAGTSRATPAHGQGPWVHAKGPIGFSGCSEQCPGAPLAGGSFCRSLMALPRRH